jgi:hypothetical protein
VISRWLLVFKTQNCINYIWQQSNFTHILNDIVIVPLISYLSESLLGSGSLLINLLISRSFHPTRALHTTQLALYIFIYAFASFTFAIVPILYIVLSEAVFV